MPRFIALLRGVNVGGHNRVPMAVFKSLLAELGYTDVVTVLNSGNAVFTSTHRSNLKHATAIAAALKDTLGVMTPVVVKSGSELEVIVRGNPIVPAESEHSRFVVVFASDAMALEALVPLESLGQDGERFVITEHAAYLHCPGGLLESKRAAALLGKPGKGVTSRNWGTVLKLAGLAGITP